MCTQHSSWRPASGTLRAVGRALCAKQLWLTHHACVSSQAFPRSAPALCVPPRGWWRGQDSSALQHVTGRFFPSEGLEEGESLLFAALVGDLGKAVLEWKEHPALPCLVRKHESKSCVNPGLDYDAVCNCRITHDLLHHAPHQTACSANSSCILLSCCLHVYLKEPLWSLFKSTSNGKWQQMVPRAVLQIPKAWMYRKPLSCGNSTGRIQESQPCQPFLCVCSPTLLCLSPSCLR